jgi:transcriptional regulator with XRE-family HTH domain
MSDPSRTLGRTRLIDALKVSGRSQSWLASLLGIKQPSVWSWVHGESRPSAHQRLALQRHLSIPADAWMTDAERAAAYGPNALPPAA